VYPRTAKPRSRVIFVSFGAQCQACFIVLLVV
jgi:hypothetical protein